MRRPDGSYFKQIPISPQFVEGMNELKQAFKAMFDRPMRKTDRLFFNTYVESLSDTKTFTRRMMIASGTKPELIYAYLKTDIRAPEPQHLTTAQFRRYSDAIGEFFRLREQGYSVQDLIDPDGVERIATDALRNVLLISAYFVEEYINVYILAGGGSSKAESDFAVSVAFVNFVKSLRSVLVLLDNGIAYDANYLVRSLYENYLRIKYVYMDPSRASQVLGFDSHSATSVNPRKPPPFKNMALSIGELQLFEILYGELSEIAHSQSVTIKHLIDEEERFDYLNVNSDFELSTLLTAHEVCLRTLVCFHLHCSCPQHFKNDLLTAMKRSFSALIIGWIDVTATSGRAMPSCSAELIEQLAKRYRSLDAIRRRIQMTMKVPN